MRILINYKSLIYRTRLVLLDSATGTDRVIVICCGGFSLHGGAFQAASRILNL